MKIRKIALLGAAAALALTGCSTNGSTTDPTSAAPTDAATTPAGDRSITLWLADQEKDVAPALPEYLKKEFAAATGATLNIEFIGWGELLPRLSTALSNPDQTPDVVEIGNTQAPTFTTVGAFTDLTDKMDELAGGAKVVPQGFIDAGSVDGKVYAVPYYWGSRYVFYDKGAFKDAGIEVPKTLAEFGDAAKKLTTDEKSGFWLPGQDWRNGISWLFANGGDIAVNEGGKWVGKLSSPESQKALAEVKDLFENATHAPKDGEDKEAWTPFNNGDTAMFMAPSWARWSVTEDLAENLGAFALPGVDGGTAPVFAGGSNMGISKASKNQDLAFELLKVVYSDGYQKVLAENGMGPVRDSFTSLMGDDEFAQAAIAASATSKLTPASAGWASVEQSRVMEEFFGKIAQGGDVAALAAETDATLNKVLN